MPIIFVYLSFFISSQNIETWYNNNRFICPGIFDSIDPPMTFVAQSKTYLHTGAQIRVQQKDADSSIVIGVVSAIKDTRQATRRNLEQALAWFKASNVEFIVANGDIATDESDLIDIFTQLASLEVPVLVLPGNSESRTVFARAFQKVAPSIPYLINGAWVRDIQADDVQFFTLPGYFDKAFLHQSAGCLYDEREFLTMNKKLMPQQNTPVMLVSHGPPLGQGPNALDWIAEKRNVGDPNINIFMRKKNIRFGIFGHILENGGQYTQQDLKTPVASNTFSSSLYINAGSLSADPWGMNNGKTSYGMATIVTIQNNQAKAVSQFFEPAPGK